MSGRPKVSYAYHAGKLCPDTDAIRDLRLAANLTHMDLQFCYPGAARRRHLLVETLEIDITWEQFQALAEKLGFEPVEVK